MTVDDPIYKLIYSRELLILWSPMRQSDIYIYISIKGGPDREAQEVLVVWKAGRVKENLARDSL